MIESKFTFEKSEMRRMPVIDRIKKVLFENELDVIDIPEYDVKVGRRTVQTVQYYIDGTESKIRVYDADDDEMNPSVAEWINIATALETWSNN